MTPAVMDICGRETDKSRTCGRRLLICPAYVSSLPPERIRRRRDGGGELAKGGKCIWFCVAPHRPSLSSLVSFFDNYLFHEVLRQDANSELLSEAGKENSVVIRVELLIWV